MSLEFRSFGTEHVDDAARLLATAYARERLASPHLPEWSRRVDGRGEESLRQQLLAGVDGPGVVALEDGALCGFLTESMRFEWKGQKAAGCGELSHGVSETEPAVFYGLLYRELARRWVADGRHLHVIGHLAHDTVLKECLFQLGFGAILAEELRGLEPVGTTAGVRVEVVTDPDPRDLVGLQVKHSGYYRESPIFLVKDESEAHALSDLQERLRSGDRLLAGVTGGEVVGLFIVGESAAEGEGALLRKTNSAQVKSAYVRPEARGQGVGRVLLDRCVAWAHEGGFDRLFVEHETANLSGSAFWGRFFDPFVSFSMRYVDNSL